MIIHSFGHSFSTTNSSFSAACPHRLRAFLVGRRRRRLSHGKVPAHTRPHQSPAGLSLHHKVLNATPPPLALPTQASTQAGTCPSAHPPARAGASVVQQRVGSDVKGVQSLLASCLPPPRSPIPLHHQQPDARSRVHPVPALSLGGLGTQTRQWVSVIVI